VVLSAVKLLWQNGGNSVGICLNTIAILFVLEMDDFMFSHFLPENLRLEVEEKGQVKATQVDNYIIDSTKLIYIVLIPIMVSLNISDYSSLAGQGGTPYVFVPFIVEEFAAFAIKEFPPLIEHIQNSKVEFENVFRPAISLVLVCARITYGLFVYETVYTVIFYYSSRGDLNAAEANLMGHTTDLGMGLKENLCFFFRGMVGIHKTWSACYSGKSDNPYLNG